jgi:hypothetical protein
MFTVFLNNSGQFLTDICLQGKKTDTVYFTDNIITFLASLCYLQGRRSHAHKVVLHIDNAPVHNTKLVTERIASEELGRMSYPLYRPDHAPCDFFFFGFVKEKLITKQYETPKALLFVVKQRISEIPGDLLLRVFASCQRKLIRYCELANDYFK